MLIEDAVVEGAIELEHNIRIIKIHSPQIASQVKPGQFLNLRVSETIYPLLRRPFSICNVEDDYVYIMYNILGEGTKMLSHKAKGEALDILGPLGNGFNADGDYELAVLVGGGLGAAPLPLLTKNIDKSKKIISFIGGRSKKDVITYLLTNIKTATDDGSEGFKGNVVQLMEENIETLKSKKVKIFACGPTPMLKAVRDFAVKYNFECEVSTECAMACGFGICQGCPIQSTESEDKYLLVCKDGPVFNIKDVVL